MHIGSLVYNSSNILDMQYIHTDVHICKIMYVPTIYRGSKNKVKNLENKLIKGVDNLTLVMIYSYSLPTR